MHNFFFGGGAYVGGLRWEALLGKAVAAGKCGLESEVEGEEMATIPTLQDAQSVMEATKILSLGMEELKKVCYLALMISIT